MVRKIHKYLGDVDWCKKGNADKMGGTRPEFTTSTPANNVARRPDGLDAYLVVASNRHAEQPTIHARRRNVH